MSLFSTMNTAASGLGVASSNLGVIGDNIANIGTTAFKKNRAEFADFLPQNVVGLAGPAQLGIGAATNTIATIFAQGSIDSSENALDLAINGDGFFVVSDQVTDFYTRAGVFALDEEGFVVNAQGYRVQGYNSDEGTLGKSLGDLQIDLDPIAPNPTTEIDLTAILSAEADYSDTPIATGLAAATLDFTGSATGTTLEDAADAADFATSVTMYDSLGVAHEVTVLYERTDVDTWTWYAVVDAGEVDDGSGTALTAGTAFQIASGVANFDTAGDLVDNTQTDVTGWTFFGAATSAPVFAFGRDSTGVATEGRVRMISGDSAVSAVFQDGYAPGDLSTMSVDTDGVVTGVYSNGQEVVLGQVALARFTSNEGLDRVGSTLFRETVASGQPAIGVADTGGRGMIIGNALEKSNVDLEDEFVSMITTQRGYQANSRVISTANDTLDELVRIV